MRGELKWIRYQKYVSVCVWGGGTTSQPGASGSSSCVSKTVIDPLLWVPPERDKQKGKVKEKSIECRVIIVNVKLLPHIIFLIAKTWSTLREIHYKPERHHEKPFTERLKPQLSSFAVCVVYSDPRVKTLNDWGEYGSEEACDWLLSAVALVILLWDWQMGLELCV